MMYGWICPHCGKVLAPDVKECTCKPEPKSNVDGKPIPLYQDLEPIFNSFYETVQPSGICNAKTDLKHSGCPEQPNYNSCCNCPCWVRCIPV